MSIYNYRRRPTHEVRVGRVGIGGSNPVRIQSMTNTDTMDTAASAAQARRIADAGGEIVRLTTQGVRHAANMEAIREELRKQGCDVPLVADVHFNPRAAFEAARTCSKVRINPGNFVDPGRTFRQLTYTDEEYAAEIDRIRQALRPFLALCREHGTAVRLGVNHGSLSDRIMSRYGDTPAGMVESVMEFLEICREEDFDQVVISIKASAVPVMVQTVELLAAEMERRGMTYPLHLGVTEAGDGEDGRLKSAVGIGALLSCGLGDTIRVSLSEAPENEIPVAAALRDYISSREGHAPVVEPEVRPAGPALDAAVDFRLGEARFPAVGVDVQPDEIPGSWSFADASSDPSMLRADNAPVVISSKNVNAPGEIASYIDRALAAGRRNPFIIRLTYTDTDADTVRLKAGADFGALLLHGYGSAIWLDAPALTADERRSISLGLLQAARLRISATEYIACPSCGRTLFDLPAVLAEVRRATAHLPGLKIGVMGCIVNGPGEMADADYGYVGAGPGRVSIYKGKQLVHKNLPASEALAALIDLIRAGGDWRDPA